MQAGEDLAHLAVGLGIEGGAGALCHQPEQAQFGLVIVFGQALQGRFKITR